MRLSETERLILSNQYRILEALYPDEAETFADARKAIEGGFAAHYGDHAQHLREETSEEICEEVSKILFMFRVLYYSAKALTDRSGIEKHRLKFAGFDGNNEPHQWTYTRYLVDDAEQFQELNEVRGDEFNSHTQTLDRYRQMLRVFEPMERDHDGNLTKDQIIRVISA